MYKPSRVPSTQINVNSSYIGEPIENKIRRIVNNKEPIKDGAPLIYTERKDGIQPQYNIRTDRFEIALDAMDKISKVYQAKRENKPSIGEQAKQGMKKEDGGAEPIRTTE